MAKSKYNIIKLVQKILILIKLLIFKTFIYIIYIYTSLLILK